MNAKQRAAENLKKLSVMLKGILDLSDDLDSLGSLEQAQIETQSRLNALREQEAAAKEGITTATAEAANITREASDTLVEARRIALTTIEQGKSDAKRLIDSAKEKADKRIADAEAKAADIEGKVTARQADLDAINAAIARAEDERARIETARATALASLGG